MSDYYTRLYQDGDEEKITELLSEVFETAYTIQEWIWKYKNNPSSKDNVICLAFTNDHELIGHFAGQAHFLNILGKTKKVINCVDGAIKPSYQKSDIFPAVNALFRQVLSNSSTIKTSLTVPGDESFPYILRLGTNLFLMKRYILETKELVTIDPSNFKHTHTDFVDPRINKLWQSVAEKEILSFKRDQKYLQWRFADHPKFKYKFHYLTDEDQLLSFAVIRESGDHVEILEIMSVFNRSELGREILKNIIHTYQEKGFTSFKFIGHDLYYYDDVFSDFKVRNIFKNFVFSLSNHPDDEKIYENPTNWSLTLSTQDMN
jgi:hypothetical protein